MPEKSEYCASKFALHGLSDALRAELSQTGIDILLASPSTTASEFFDVADGAASKPQGRFGALPAESVARRIASAMAAGRHEIILSASGKLLVWLDLYVGEARVSDNLVLFARPKHMDLTPPEFSVDVTPVDAGRAFDVTVRADRPALYVWLELDGARFGDNFFDLRPGRARTVRVTTAAPVSAFGSLSAASRSSSSPTTSVCSVVSSFSRSAVKSSSTSTAPPPNCRIATRSDEVSCVLTHFCAAASARN